MGEVHGGQLVVETLRKEGVEYLFSLSGGHINPIYQAAVDAGIKIIDTRHEQAAAHMAEAWGRLTRKPGVCVVTAGPGLTDALTGVANARMAASPMLLISGRSGVNEDETLALQEMEQLEFVKPLVKWGKTVYETRRLGEYVAMAYRQAMTGRPGPVYLEMPVDVLSAKVDERKAAHPEGYRPMFRPGGSSEALDRAIAMLMEAKKPAIIAGSGSHYADAGPELKEFIEQTGIPVFTSLLGRGVVADSHPLCAGKLITGGMVGLADCDLVMLLGARMSLYTLFGRPPVIPLLAKVIQVDIEGSEIGRNRKVDLGIVGDAKEVLKGLLERGRERTWAHRAWGEITRKKCQAVEQNLVATLGQKKAEIHPVYLMKVINEFLDKDALVVGDGGDTQVWTAMMREVNAPGHYLESGVFGCLGVGVPFALAAKLRYPDKQVLLTMGDGSAGLNIMEFDTALRHNIPIVMVIMNDCSWGMIRHLQNVKNTPEQKVACELGRVAYDQVVTALGGYGETVEDPDQIRPALERAFASGKPACLNVYTDRGAISPFTMLMFNMGA